MKETWIDEQLEILGRDETAIAQTDGEALRQRFEEVMKSYWDFYNALDRNTQHNTSVRKIEIVLRKSHEVPNIGTGRLKASLVRGIRYDNTQDCYSYFFETTLKLKGDGFNHQLGEPEVFGLRGSKGLTDNKLPDFPYEGNWTPEHVADTEARLGELLPQAKDTYRLLLEAACDPNRNYEHCEAAQAYRESLQVAA